MTENELYPAPDEYDEYTMKESPTYTPPKVWEWDQDEENRFSKINRPIAGPTHDKDLPVGEHPLQVYSLATPNGVKVTVMLEELLALGIDEAEYDAWLVNIMEGDQMLVEASARWEESIDKTFFRVTNFKIFPSDN